MDESKLGYVTSLVPAHQAELMAIPLNKYRALPAGSPLEGVPALRLTRTIWGADRTVVLFLSEQLRAGQIRGLQQHLNKRLAELAEWKKQLAKPRSGPRNKASAQKHIERLLSGQHVGDVLRIKYYPRRKGANRLEYWLDEDARRHLETEVFGKRIVVTNHSDWSTEDILLAYRGQSHVEAVFRQLKDDEHLAVRPQYHWTDQKIQVHAFISLLAFLLAQVVGHEAKLHGHREGLSGLLDRLGEVRLAMVLRPAGKKGGRPRADWLLEEADDELSALFRSLVPDKPPFVYTDKSVQR